MTEAFSAEYANFKPVPSRNKLQIVLEVPLEQGEEIMKLLGMPSPGSTKWVGVAPLKLNEQPVVQQRIPDASTAPDVEKDSGQGLDSRKSWDELPYPQRAGIMSNDPVFWEFCRSSNASEAAEYIRAWCDVDSRADIKSGTPAERRFISLCNDFDTWKRFERGR